MSTDLDTRPDLSTTDGDDDVHHIVCCCSLNVALCGENVADEDVLDDPDWDESLGCKRCLALESSVCILCGWDPAKGCYCGTCK